MQFFYLGSASGGYIVYIGVGERERAYVYARRGNLNIEGVSPVSLVSRTCNFPEQCALPSRELKAECLITRGMDGWMDLLYECAPSRASVYTDARAYIDDAAARLFGIRRARLRQKVEICTLIVRRVRELSTLMNNLFMQGDY